MCLFVFLFLYLECFELGGLVNNEFDRLLSKAIVTSFKVLSRYLPGVTEEKQEEPQDIRCSDRDLNQAPP